MNLLIMILSGVLCVALASPPASEWTEPVAAMRKNVKVARLNVAYENADTFRDFNERERFFIAPSVNWIVAPTTTVLPERKARGAAAIARHLQAELQLHVRRAQSEQRHQTQE
ncbi:MAG: hypothetical protein ACREAM_25360 [Blastocatellia bacterium]